MGQQMAEVTLGKFGDIKPQLTQFGRRTDYVDLNFICEDGLILAHRFIIGAQSRFLRKLMISGSPCDECDPVTIIHVPEVSSKTMTTVLRFLYTGKLNVTQAQVPVVKELLENVLRIDAKINLPSSGFSNGNSRKRKGDGNDDDDGGDSDGSGGGRGSPESKKKAIDAAVDKLNNLSNGAKICKQESTNGGYGDAPLSPPHSLQGDDKCLEGSVTEEVEGQISEYEDNDEDDTEKPKLTTFDCKLCGKSFRLEIALRLHMKKHKEREDEEPQPSTSRAALENEDVKRIPLLPTQNRSKFLAAKSTSKGSIAGAPNVIRKRTGGMPFRNATTHSSLNNRDDTGLSDEEVEEGGSKDVVDYAAVAWDNAEDDFPDMLGEHDFEENPSRPRPRTSNNRNVYGEEDYCLSAQQPDYERHYDQRSEWMPTMSMGGSTSHIGEQPPEPGLVIHRGEWVTPEVREKYMRKSAKRFTPAAKSSNLTNVRGYNYRPFTLTGTYREETMDAVQRYEDGEKVEEGGPFSCTICGSTYAWRRSLDAHMRRNHNPNLKATCPECGKGLSGKPAMKKHLLSHRPESEWPHTCPLCGKMFQAKGDLPKHLLTARHQSDNIPQQNTAAWTDLMNQSYVHENIKLMNERFQAYCAGESAYASFTGTSVRSSSSSSSNNRRRNQPQIKQEEYEQIEGEGTSLQQILQAHGISEDDYYQ